MTFKRGKNKFLRKFRIMGVAAASSALVARSLDGDREVETLLELWALGLLSAATLCTIAIAANISAPRPQMTALAGIGAQGTWTRNCHRDLARKLQFSENNVAETLDFELPLKIGTDPNLPTLVPYSMLLPHEVFSFMYKHHLAEFQKFVVGNGLADFWAAVRPQDPRLESLPAHVPVGEHLIALRIHGDNVPIGKGKSKSLDVISISSMTACSGASWDTRYMLSAIVEQCKFKGNDVTEATMDLVWRILIWSLLALQDNRWPSLDWNGNPLQGWRGEKKGPLCGPYHFKVFGVAADLDYLCNRLRLRKVDHRTNPCFRCFADGTGIPWTDLTPTARWRAVLVLLAHWFFIDKHLLFSNARLGVNLFHVLLDVLHLIDLGFGQACNACILYLCPFSFGMRGTLDEKLLCSGQSYSGHMKGLVHLRVSDFRMTNLSPCGKTAAAAILHRSRR